MKQLASKNISTSFFFLEYTLVPCATYPTQLIQSIEAVNYLLSSGYAPSQIILSGDSAGANLSLGILSHTIHPHPECPPLQLSEPFKAAVLISPWTQFKPDQASTIRNQCKDFLSPASSEGWGLAYLAGRRSDAYTEAFYAPLSWWEGVKVCDVIVTAGADEILLDSIKEWTAKFQVS